MNNIEHRINNKQALSEKAKELGFDSYTEALKEYHDHGLKADDIAHLFNREWQSIDKHIKMLGLSFN